MIEPAHALLLAGGVIALLLVLVLVVRLPAFLALLACSVLAALGGGLPPQEVAAAIAEAMGSTLGTIAIVIGLGAIFGELLRGSGGAAAIAERLLAAAGERRAPWALGAVGLIVAIPVFFDVAFILFVPMLFGLAARSGRSHLVFAFPLLAGLAVAHAFIPPTPGPVAVAGILGAELGWVILCGLLAGTPALVAGVWFSRRAVAKVGRVEAERDGAAEETSAQRSSAGAALILIGLPLMLILTATVAKVVLAAEDPRRAVIELVGHPIIALLLATLLALWVLGRRAGRSGAELQAISLRALEPVGLILLLTGAGGVLGKILVRIGVGEAVAGGVADLGVPVVVLGFVLAAAVRVAQGSATVSMVTAAGLTAPVAQAAGVSGLDAGALTVAIAAGATVLSHVNDSGFWLVSRYLGLSERQTLSTWTVLTTLVGGVGFAVALALSWVF